MAPRPAWKGYLKLSLVTCAIELTNVVTHAEKVSFRILNRKTGTPVKRIYVDAGTGKPLEEGDEIKGYEVSDGDFVHVEEDEIEAVQIESSHTMSLDGFVEKSSIEQIYLDTPYYLSPADKVSEEAFAVIRAATGDGDVIEATIPLDGLRRSLASIEAAAEARALPAGSMAEELRAANIPPGDWPDRP